MTLEDISKLLWSVTVKPVNLVAVGDCIECTSHYKSGGYTRITVSGKEQPLHRVVYELLNGAVSSDLVIRHTCDNRGCCNPDHLVPGTNGDNIRDAVERSGMNIGINNGMCKLSWDQVQEIRSSKERSRVLEERYKVSRKTIYNIRNDRTHA